MYMRLVLAMCLLSVAVLPLSAQRRDQGRSVSLPRGARIAVVASQSRGGAQVDSVVSEMLTTALRRSGWRVLERQDLDAILREQQLARSGQVDPATAVETGRLVGAEYILLAKATEFGVRDERYGGIFGLSPLGGLQVRRLSGRVVLDVRVTDVRTGEVLGSATGEGRIDNYGGTLVGGSWVGGSIDLGGVDIRSREWSESLLGRASRKAVDDALRRLLGAQSSLVGRVLAVDSGGDCVVDLGSADGLKPGDRLELLAVEAIRDKAGNAVWTEETPVGSLELTDVRSDRSKARSVDGRQPAEGDMVRFLFPEKPANRRR